MQGILVTGGDQPEFVKISSYFDANSYIVAADSGLDYCLANSIEPDYIIGDMDSLASKELLLNFNSNIIEQHSSEKDFTDTELGLIHLEKKNCSKKIIIGGGGGRLDHILAITALFERPDPPDLWITENEEIHFIDEKINGSGRAGETISLFPVGVQTCTMNSKGLKWPLDQLIWRRGDYGISNTITGNSFSVTMRSGQLILIREIQKKTLH